MKTNISYNNETIAALDPGQSATLLCDGQRMKSDVMITTENNIVQVSGDSETAVMSQKATTDSIAYLGEILNGNNLFIDKRCYEQKTFNTSPEWMDFIPDPTRISHTHLLVFNFDVIARCDSGYQQCFDFWDGTNRISGTAWMQTDYKIKAGTIFTITIAKTDNSEISLEDYDKVKLSGLAQSTGENETPISQKATTEAFDSAAESAPFLLKEKFTRQSLYGTAFGYSETRIAYPHPTIYANDVIVKVEDGYSFEVDIWANDTLDPSSLVREGSWLTEPYTIPANTYFTLLIRKIDNGTITIEEYNKVKLYRDIDFKSEKELEANLKKVMSDSFESGKESNPFLAKDKFERKTLHGSTLTFTPSTNRIAHPHAILYENDIVVKVENGYKVEVDIWADDSLDPSAFVSEGSWLTEPYTIPANTYFTILIAKIDNSEIDVDSYSKVKLYRAIDFVTETETETEITPRLEKDVVFAELFNNSGVAEPFLFFTDPHFIDVSESGGWWRGEYLDVIKKHYADSSAGFVLCGGDWLNNNNTKTGACYMLSQIKGKMRELFDKFYLVMGNHDTNYQGIEASSSAANTGRLTQQTIYNLWYGEHGKSYYSFKGANTKFYVFDCGTDWENMGTTLTDFSTEQINYFVEQLKENDDLHIAIASHMVGVNDSGSVIHPMINRITEIANAYNARSTVVQNGVTYDFTQKTGKVEFVIAGHTHSDMSGTLNGIPYIITTNVQDGADVTNYPTFDLVFVDYTARILKTVRIGNGVDREIALLN